MYSKNIKRGTVFAIVMLLLVMTSSIGLAGKPPGDNPPVDRQLSQKLPPVTAYEVTITNLTDGQPLTPPLIATHRRPIHVFEVGEAASLGIQELAENGNLAPLLGALEDAKHIHEFQVGEAPWCRPRTPAIPGSRIRPPLPLNPPWAPSTCPSPPC